MGMEGHLSSCYCCAKPSTSRASAMDIDAALNELGMLSTTSNSRREYMRERAKRDRNLSEPGLTRNLSEPGLIGRGVNSNGTSTSPMAIAPTPSNSPSRPGALSPGGYQILCINPQFVTSLTSGSSPPTNKLTPPVIRCQPTTLTSAAAAVVATSTNREPEDIQLRVIEFGAKYSQDSLEHEARASRLSRSKSTRLKRFKKPYDVPWRQQGGQCFLRSTSDGVGATPEKVISRSTDRACSSNVSTPEKSGSANGIAPQCTVTRSRSLDEIDFNKLHLAESENHNLVLERKEIETMSQHLQNLQVNE